MIKLQNKVKLMFLKLILKKKLEYKNNIIKKSIVQNSSIKISTRICINSIKSSKNFIIRKQCIFSKNRKNISKKNNISRFLLHKIMYSNLNLNFKIYEK
jgi:hypothetical protein